MIFNHKLVVSIVMCIFWATTPVISEECYEEVETAMKSFDGYDGYYSIIKKDLNIDGRPEILITTSDGGNCCAPEIKIIFLHRFVIKLCSYSKRGTLLEKVGIMLK